MAKTAALADLPADAPAADIIAALRPLSAALTAELSGPLATATRAVLAAVHQQMMTPARGLPPIPVDVGSFAALHDHRDANMFVINALAGVFPVPEHYGDQYADGRPLSDADQAAVDAETAAANAVMAQVDRILAVEAEAIRAARAPKLQHGGVFAMSWQWADAPGESVRVTDACAEGRHGYCSGWVALGSHLSDDMTTHVDALPCACAQCAHTPGRERR